MATTGISPENLQGWMERYQTLKAKQAPVQAPEVRAADPAPAPAQAPVQAPAPVNTQGWMERYQELKAKQAPAQPATPAPTGGVALPMDQPPVATTPEPGGVRLAPLVSEAAEGAIQGVTGFVDMAKSALNFMGQNIPRGLNPLADIARPVENVTGVLSGPGLGETTIKAARAIAYRFGIEEKDIEPQNRAERMIGRVLKEVTGTAVGIPIIRQISQAARVASVGGELMLGALSGSAAAVAGEVAPGNQVAEITAQMSPYAATLLYALGKGALGAAVGKNLHLTEEERIIAVSNALQETMGDMNSPALEKRLQRMTESVDLVKQKTGQAPMMTVGEATGSPGLLALQVEELNSMPVPQAVAVVEAKQKATALYQDALAAHFPDTGTGNLKSQIGKKQLRIKKALEAKKAIAEGNLERVRQIEVDRVTRLQTEAESRLQAAQDIVKQQTDALISQSPTQPGMQRSQAVARSMETAGREIRRAVADADSIERSLLRRGYENLLDSPANEIVDTAPDLVAPALALRDESMEQFQGADLPRSLAEFLDGIRRRAAAQKGLIPPNQKGIPQQAQAADLLTYMRRNGGIKLEGESELVSEFEALLSPRETGTSRLLNNQGGKTIQEMAEIAHQGQYISSPDKRELLDLMSKKMNFPDKPILPMDQTDIFGDIRGGGLPPDIAAQLQNIDLESVPLSLKDLHTVRSRTLAEMRSMNRVDDANSIRLAGQFVSTIDSAMANMAARNQRPDVYTDLLDLNKQYRSYATKFRVGAGEKILQQKSGIPSMSVAAVAKEYLKNPEAGEQFVNAVGNRADARAALETYLDHDLYLKAVDSNTGMFNPTRAEKWMADNDTVIRFFPQLQRKYANVFDAQSSLAAIEESAKRVTPKDIQRAVADERSVQLAEELLKKTAARVERQTAKLETFVNTFLGSPGAAAPERMHVRLQSLSKNAEGRLKIKYLAQRLPDQDSRNELGRALYDSFMTQQGSDPLIRNVAINPNAVRRFLKAHRDIFQTLYGKEHVGNLDKIVDGMTAIQATERAPQATFIGSKRFSKPGSKSAQSALLDAIAPVRIPLASMKARLARYSIRAVADFFIRKNIEDLHNLMHEAMFNPEVSQTMAMLRSPKLKPRITQARLRAHMTMLGADARGEEDDGGM